MQRLVVADYRNLRQCPLQRMECKTRAPASEE
jgi:hypothetical protein